MEVIVPHLSSSNIPIWGSKFKLKCNFEILSLINRTNVVWMNWQSSQQNNQSNMVEWVSVFFRPETSYLLLYCEKTTEDVIIAGRRCGKPWWYFSTAVIRALCIQTRTDDVKIPRHNCLDWRQFCWDSKVGDFSGRTSLYLSVGSSEQNWRVTIELYNHIISLMLWTSSEESGKHSGNLYKEGKKKLTLKEKATETVNLLRS